MKKILYTYLLGRCFYVQVKDLVSPDYIELY